MRQFRPLGLSDVRRTALSGQFLCAAPHDKEHQREGDRRRETRHGVPPCGLPATGIVRGVQKPTDMTTPDLLAVISGVRVTPLRRGATIAVPRYTSYTPLKG